MTRGDEIGWSRGRLVAMGLLGLVFGALLATSGAQLLVPPEPAPPPAMPAVPDGPRASGGQEAAPPSPPMAIDVPPDGPAPAASPPTDRANAPLPDRDTRSSVAGDGRHDAPGETAAPMVPSEAVAQRPALPAPTEVKPVEGAVGTVGTLAAEPAAPAALGEAGEQPRALPAPTEVKPVDGAAGTVATLAAEPAAPTVGPGHEAPAVAGDAAQRPVPDPAPAKQAVARPKEVTASSPPVPDETAPPTPSSPGPAMSTAPREPVPQLAPTPKAAPAERRAGPRRAARRQDPPANAAAPRLRGGVGAYTPAPDGMLTPAAPGFVVMDGAGAADVIRVIVPRGGR